MAGDDVKRAGRLAYRATAPEGEELGEPVLFLHGFPESSYMWRDALGVAAGAGRRGIAPDLLGYGDSEPDLPGTWARQIEALEEFAVALALERVVLVVHDWGGLIGLRWACDHPERIAGLLISDSGFFPDGRWHGMAKALRTEGQGEQMVEALDRDALGHVMAANGPGFSEAAVDHYFRAFSTPEGRAGVLDLYRSGEFAELEPYQGQLAALGVPTLLLWGAEDEFAPVGGAHRLKGQIPDAELEIIEGARHFVWSEAPEHCASALERFLTGASSG